ncbi:hypothetical protein ACTFIU_000676 [Dictyostelium citrinum]
MNFFSAFFKIPPMNNLNDRNNHLQKSGYKEITKEEEEEEETENKQSFTFHNSPHASSISPSLSSLTSPSLLPTDPIELEVYLRDHLPLKDISKKINIGSIGDTLAKEFSRCLVILIKSDDKNCIQQQPSHLVQLFWNFGLNDYHLNQKINSFFSIHNLLFCTPRMVDSISIQRIQIQNQQKQENEQDEKTKLQIENQQIDEKKLNKIEEHTQEKECIREEQEETNNKIKQPTEDFNSDEEIGYKLSKKNHHQREKEEEQDNQPVDGQDQKRNQKKPLYPVGSLVEAKC